MPSWSSWGLRGWPWSSSRLSTAERTGRCCWTRVADGRLLSVTGTLFAVVLAFIILAAFQTYDGARAGAATEANSLLDMFRTAALYPVGQRDRLRADFVCYARTVVNEEWPAMRHGASSPLVDYWVGAYRTQFGRLTLRSAREQFGFQTSSPRRHKDHGTSAAVV